MNKRTKWLAALVLLSSAGCSRADMSDARRDYLLAKDHGWLDLTVKAPQAAGVDPSKRCSFTLLVNGEPLLRESAPVSQTEGSGHPIGYRLVAPAGKLQVELEVATCVPKELLVAVPLTLEKDHLSVLNFDGKALVAGASTPFAPTSLEQVKTEVLGLQERGKQSDAAVSTLTAIAGAGFVLNLIGLLAFFWMRRRPGG